MAVVNDNNMSHDGIHNITNISHGGKDSTQAPRNIPGASDWGQHRPRGSAKTGQSPENHVVVRGRHQTNSIGNGNEEFSEATKGQEAKTNSKQLDDLRAVYLEALEDNHAAQRRCDDAVSAARRTETQTQMYAISSMPALGDDDGEGPAALLARHIELRRLQELHSSLIVLADDLQTAKSLGIPARLDAGLPSMSVPPINARSESGNRITVLEDTLSRIMQALEMAVVQAHQDAVRERARLEEVKSLAAPNPTPQQHVRAMLAARQVLTAWVEEALELCQGQEQGQPEHQETNTMNEEARITDAMIDEEYERYLNGRRRVLDAVAALGTPVRGHDGQNVNETRPAAIYTVTAPAPATRDVRLGVEPDGLLHTVEKNFLPAAQRQSTAQTYLAFTMEQIDDEMAKTTNVLDRLSDESQLLQAFPILARSGRFKHAASALGKRANSEDEMKDVISRRMEPWMFAADAADAALSGALEKALGEGKQAMESVSKNLAELRLLKEADDTFVL